MAATGIEVVPVIVERTMFGSICSLRKSPFCRPLTSIGSTCSLKKSLAISCALKDLQYQIKEEGQVDSLDYRVFLLDHTGKKISPWHDVPLHLGSGVFNFVVEVPKETNLRMEVATDEQYTPLKQDKRWGRLRHNMNWNYGLLPQTWEDPLFSNAEVEGAFGDNDPVDVVDIGSNSAKIGEILKVKPLGALALVDEGELDWKIIAICLNDPKAYLVHDVDDIEKYFPDTLTALSYLFRDYKICGGVLDNKYALGNKPANKDYALKVIRESHDAWAKLVRRSVPAGKLSLE